MSARQAAGMKGGISGEFNKCSHKKNVRGEVKTHENGVTEG